MARKDVTQTLASSVIAAIIALLAVSSYIFPRKEAESLTARVSSNEEMIRDQYKTLDSKIDKIRDILLEMNVRD